MAREAHARCAYQLYRAGEGPPPADCPLFKNITLSDFIKGGDPPSTPGRCAGIVELREESTGAPIISRDCLDRDYAVQEAHSFVQHSIFRGYGTIQRIKPGTSTNKRRPRRAARGSN